MIARLNFYWAYLRTSLWFIPALMGAGAVILAIVLIVWGNTLLGKTTDFWWLFTGDADNTRDLLSSLLSGMITMTSLVVSITMVVLTLAAGQLGPRLIRNFMGDRQVQAVIGLFVATILYLIVVLRTISDRSQGELPHLAVTGGTALTALSLFVLLFFVHKLARSIIADNVVRGVTDELGVTIERLLPEEPPRPGGPVALPGDGAWVPLDQDGYIQTIDFDKLVGIAERADAVIRVMVRPGHFVLAQGEHVSIHPARACTDTVVDAVQRTFTFGAERVPTQDLEHGIRQLVEVAARALSPGINDTFTAVAVIDNLSSSLAKIFLRAPEASVRHDRAGRVRLVRNVADFHGVVAAGFDQIRQAGATMPAILIRLVDAIARLAPYARTQERRKPLLEQLEMILEAGEKNLAISRDLEILRARCRDARKKLA